MTNREIHEELGKLVREERRITKEILILINLAESQKAFLELGYPNLFEWLVKEFSYSHSAAYRRIEAAKLLQAVPEIEQKLQSGAVNLSTLCKTQTLIRSQEKCSGLKVSAEMKAEIVEQIENKSTVETERLLFSLFSEVKEVSRERHKVIDEENTLHTIKFNKEMSGNLKRAKEVLSHQFPSGSDAEVIAYALQFLLKKKDPLMQPASATRILFASATG